MQREIINKSCSLAGTSDLTVIAPIRKGLAPSLESVTYKSRVKRVLRLLHAGRSAAHESELLRVFSDAVERVGRIHSVRIAVLEPQDQVLLAVTFDGAWESYVRVIWQKVSRLLDLIFCNTEDYCTGWDHSYAAWGRWLHGRQAETAFLYAPPGLTSADGLYLRMHEQLQRQDGAQDLRLGRLTAPSAERIADRLVEAAEDPSQPLGPGAGTGAVHMVGRAAVRQALRGVVGLHRLSDMHLPGSEDGVILHRAARELLPELQRMMNDAAYRPALQDHMDRFDEAMTWFARDVEPLPAPRQSPRLDVPAAFERNDIQGGIVRPYEGVTDGALLLVACRDRAALAALLAQTPVTPDAAASDSPPEQIVWNLALTFEGLREAGLSEDELERFPDEFRQGMAARAGLLGDLRVNHPRRWRLPALNWSDGVHATDLSEHDHTRARVPLEAVHAALQVRTGADGSPRSRLHTALAALMARCPGTTPLSLQWMQRHASGNEHFGFGDALSQPSFGGGLPGTRLDNRVLAGEVLLGHPNRADRVCPFTDPAGRSDDEVVTRRALFHNGSFLVVRKLRQDVGVLHGALAGARSQGIDANLALAKMMGRWPAADPRQPGAPLASPAPSNGNDFDFAGDDGRLCPVHAHIRRAHPRQAPSSKEPPGARVPRLVRRGMPYGPFLADASDADDLARERGLMFMAYNQSIGEQFEVVQRWLVGGNSTGGLSGHADPFVGLAEPGRRRWFAFEDGGRRHRIALDGSDTPGDEAPPLVRLEWGAYLFAPSIGALRWLHERASQAPAARSPVEWQAARGAREIARLQAVEHAQGADAARAQWKAALEDPEAITTHLSASVWAAIRERHGGVLRTPYGVLAASRQAVDAVLVDSAGRYSVAGYQERLRNYIGEIYLGLDAGTDGRYERESQACNAAIAGLGYGPARALAFEATTRALERFCRRAHDLETAKPPEQAAERWELTLDVRELVDDMLADLCEAWFGLREGPHWQRGGLRWDWRVGAPVRYPGHFTAPSRATFQPWPGADVDRLARAHGQALTQAMRRAIEAGEIETRAQIAGAVLLRPPGAQDADLAARTLVGALMGFLPTTDGCLRRVFQEWTRDGSFWRLRALAAATIPDATAGDSPGKLDALLSTPLRQALQLRPVPELVWRTATQAHALARDAGDPEPVQAGERIVAALVSAMQQAFEQGGVGTPDLTPMFGGARRPGGPTHACPAYSAATGVLAGFFAALVGSPLPLRSGGTPTTLYVDGPVARDEEVEVTHWESEGLRRPLDLQLAAVPSFALGDSWAAKPTLYLRTLSGTLEELGHRVSRVDGTRLGLRLAELFETPPDGRPLIDGVVTHYEALLRDAAARPRFVLLSAGGNDVTHAEAIDEPPVLWGLVRNKRDVADNLARAVDDDALNTFLQPLGVQYAALFERLLAVDKTMPLVIQGYDHPLPGHRSSVLSSCLVAGHDTLPPMRGRSRGWTLLEARTIMATLIDRLNQTIACSVQSFGGRVVHVNLAGVLQRQANRQGIDITTLWANEMHPNRTGFGHLARALLAALPEALKIE